MEEWIFSTVRRQKEGLENVVYAAFPLRSRREGIDLTTAEPALLT